MGREARVPRDPHARLRRQMAKLTTLAQFEEILVKASHPEAMRRLLAPLLPDDLPCCGIGRLDRVRGAQEIRHGLHCPEQQRRVVLVS